MRTIIVLIVLLCCAVAFIQSKKIGCNRACMAKALEGKLPQSDLRACIVGCLSVNGTKDDTVKTIKQLQNFIKQLKSGVQSTEARLGKAFNQARTMEDVAVELSDIASGATLEVTTSALNVRSGPCTDKQVVASLGSGQRVQFTGQVQSGCGYTWYGIKGSFGSGFAASNFLREVRGGAGIAPGATLEVTTSALNVRSGPCTDKQVVASLGSGQRVQFTGQVQSGCGYTWYGIKGSFGSGFAASDFLREVKGGGGSTCNTRNYPLFKQCDGRWANNRLGRDSTICAVGCLMSSVSMALNGLGKKINGQEPNPGTLNAFLLSHGGYMGDLFVWGSVSGWGLSYVGQPSNIAEIKNYVCQNYVVILNVNQGGHWVLATGVNSAGGFNVHDPGFSRTSYTAGEVVRAGVYRV